MPSMLRHRERIGEENLPHPKDRNLLLKNRND
jgi:hypothetical protein